ncbi:MAG: hypothetical protein ABIP74_04475 [Candidatus Saccharimonas sp.]
MTRRLYGKTILPPYLEVPTVNNLPLDELGVISEHGIIVYPTADGQELYLDAKSKIHPSRLIRRGHVAVMRCIGWSGEIGVVADMRYVQDSRHFNYSHFDDMPSDVLLGLITLDEWREKNQEVALAAIASTTPEGERAIDGDADFHAAAAQLTELVDSWIDMPHKFGIPGTRYHQARMYGYVASMGELLSGI